MEAALDDFLTTGVFAFILTFVRLGSAIMVLPGFADTYVPERVRVILALSLTFVLLPVTSQYLPADIPGTFQLVYLIGIEFVIGIFFGTVARIFLLAVDTAGMIISTMSGLGSAQILNPALSSQGSLLGALFTIGAVVIIFMTDMHHLLIMGVLDTYERFPVQEAPDMGGMAQFIAKSVSAAFAVGIKMSAPFIVMTMLLYVGMGVLSRVMPQVQIFIVTLPLQILLSLSLLVLTFMAIIVYWAEQFEQAIVFLLGS